MRAGDMRGAACISPPSGYDFVADLRGLPGVLHMAGVEYTRAQAWMTYMLFPRHQGVRHLTMLDSEENFHDFAKTPLVEWEWVE